MPLPVESSAMRTAPFQARILVIEDDPGVGCEVSAALEDYGFAFEWVKTGCDGLRRARWRVLLVLFRELSANRLL